MRRPLWTAVAFTIFVLTPRTCLTFSIEPSLYSHLTKDPARGGVSLNDRLADKGGGQRTLSNVLLASPRVELARRESQETRLRACN